MNDMPYTKKQREEYQIIWDKFAASINERKKCVESKLTKRMINGEKNRHQKFFRESNKVYDLYKAKQITEDELIKRNNQIVIDIFDTSSAKKYYTQLLLHCSKESHDYINVIKSILEFGCKKRKEEPRCEKLKSMNDLKIISTPDKYKEFEILKMSSKF